MQKNEIKLIKVFGFQVNIDISWFFIFSLIAWSLAVGYFPRYFPYLNIFTYWVIGFIGASGLFLSILIHEFMHSIMGKKYGIKIKEITLFLFGGMSKLEQEPKSAKAEFLMAAIGPLTSVMLGFIFFLIFLLIKKINGLMPIKALLWFLGSINIFLAVFNLIPAYPLDGGRIFRSILWKIKNDLRWSTKISINISSFFSILLIIFGGINLLMGSFINGLWLILIGFFLFSSARLSYQEFISKEVLKDEPVKRFMKTDPITVSPDISIKDFIENYVYNYHYKMFPVFKDNIILGFVTTNKIKNITKEEWSTKTIRDIMTEHNENNTLNSESNTMEALALMKKNGLTRLLIIDNNKLTGIITLKDLLEFLTLKKELEGIK